MEFDRLREIYRDYVNNYLTMGVFAERNGLTFDQANRLIQLGRECHSMYCDMIKERDS